MEVMRENVYLSRTIEVQEGQKVVDTGLYGIVRHPMYAATVIMFLAMPMVLGSWASFGVMLVYPFVIIVRILNEEKVPEDGLEGYKEYRKKVRYRLIPFIWYKNGRSKPLPYKRRFWPPLLSCFCPICAVVLQYFCACTIINMNKYQEQYNDRLLRIQRASRQRDTL